MRNLSAVFILTLLLGCGDSADQTGSFIPEGMEGQEKTRYLQYLVQGKKIYQANCANCHQNTGEGMTRLYPPLAKSDYLKSNLDQIACLVKYGKSGPMMVNGLEYNMQMPANRNLSSIEIAEILTYISNNWGNETGLISVQDVDRQLAECSY